MEKTANKAGNRTDRRKHRTRGQLLQAAIDLLLEQDYEEIMIDDITDRADVGRRTFYNHFVNKQDCVTEAITGRFIHHAAASQEVIEAARYSDEALAVAAMAQRVFRDIAQDPITRCLMLYPRILSEAIAESQRDYILANLARGLATNRLQPAMPLESLEPILTWGFVGLVITSIERDSQRADSLEWARFVLHTFCLGKDEIQGLLAELDRA